ncbi:hypothetical protein CLAIMM_14683 [Cladophialophora immunda]|nr:hypothetical protein CLAIMM_14683 [Cladophialophora immunda]
MHQVIPCFPAAFSPSLRSSPTPIDKNRMADSMSNLARWYRGGFLLLRQAWRERGGGDDDDDDNWDPRARELLLDPYLPPYYRAVLLTMVIHTDDDPLQILDQLTRVVEELEATVIAGNEPDDPQVKELREVVQFLEEIFLDDSGEESEEGGETAEGKDATEENDTQTVTRSQEHAEDK